MLTPLLFRLEGVDGVWLDPARRVTSTSGTKRIWDPEAFSPPLSFVESLAATGRAVGVKMGPGMPHESVPAGCEAQWVSVGGDVTEVTLWFNSVAGPESAAPPCFSGRRVPPRSPVPRISTAVPQPPWVRQRATCTSRTAR